MDKKQWLEELANKFVEKAELTPKDAEGIAETLAEDMYPDNTPAEAFEEEISNWSE
jgi:hypothetical protein